MRGVQLASDGRVVKTYRAKAQVSVMNLTSGLMLQSILFVVNNENMTKTPVPQLNHNESETTRCYGIYGCYSISYPWLTDNRPVAFFPADPEALNVRYPTFTRYNMKIPYFLDPNEPEKIKNRRFNPKGPFFFIAHGYLEGGNKPWIQKMAETLLSLSQNVDGTVIAIDWREASSPPYTQAVANIRLLGTITAHIIYDMYVHLNLKNLDNFHFIGHSLGSHMGGYTGSALQKEFGLKLGRITGLDPAEPLFKQVDEIVRLDRSDAKYVDIIHTDASPFISGGLGLTESIGHLDFYPNGGLDQPGCGKGMMQYMKTKDGAMFHGLREYIGCNHIRSYEYFIESITTTCPFLAIACPSYNDFATGICFQCAVEGQPCLRFGYHSNIGYHRLVKKGMADPNRSLHAYFITGEEAPFCRMHFRVTVNISSAVESSSHGGDFGRFLLTVIGSNGTFSSPVALDDHQSPHKPGTQKTVMIATTDLGAPVAAKVEYEYEMDPLNFFTWRPFSTPRVYVAWIHIESLEYKKSIFICSPNQQPVENKKPIFFQQKHCRDNILPATIRQSSTFVGY